MSNVAVTSSAKDRPTKGTTQKDLLLYCNQRIKRAITPRTCFSNLKIGYEILLGTEHVVFSSIFCTQRGLILRSAMTTQEESSYLFHSMQSKPAA